MLTSLPNVFIGNHTTAIVQISNVINQEDNDNEQQGYKEVDNAKIKLELFLGGDYKLAYYTKHFISVSTWIL